jgi:hypothetical protein
MERRTSIAGLRSLCPISGSLRCGTFRVPRTASWFALYNGDKTQFAVTTWPIAISVR